LDFSALCFLDRIVAFYFSFWLFIQKDEHQLYDIAAAPSVVLLKFTDLLRFFRVRSAASALDSSIFSTVRTALHFPLSGLLHSF